MRNALFHLAGLVGGTANMVRHRVRGYRSPRPFSASDIERTVKHDLAIVNALTWWSSLDFTGKRVLEIGPGPDLGTGAVMIARGATRYLAVDRFDLASAVKPELYEALGRELGAPVDVDRLEFVTTEFPALPDVDGTFDVILSNATLEHLEDVPGTFARLKELAAPGCLMCHYVDARTHMRWIRERDPLNVLRYSERVYRRLLDFPGAPNRMLASDYVAAAERAGFSATVIPAEIAADEYLRRVRPRLAGRFRRYPASDLGMLDFALVSRSP